HTGIRPAGRNAGEQRRIMTPGRAQQAGVDYMVIGGPITQSADPDSTLRSILNDLQEA
ncbi:MAG TPA: orotidine-5'-phosphate decarboxylase, partial [Erwinia persicina]|nr:orotidine-5'-phosphate decarboxylase [Erwinia persicina]